MVGIMKQANDRLAHKRPEDRWKVYLPVGYGYRRRPLQCKRSPFELLYEVRRLPLPDESHPFGSTIGDQRSVELLYTDCLRAHQAIYKK